MYRDYFKDYCEVKPEFSKEFVSLWSGWLGEENLYKLDDVTEKEWERFNTFIKLLSKNHLIKLVDCNSESTSKITNIENTLATYKQSKDKDTSLFSKYILPELECVITEDWDHTYIIWHKENGAVEALSPYIKQAGLQHFNE